MLRRIGLIFGVIACFAGLNVVIHAAGIILVASGLPTGYFPFHAVIMIAEAHDRLRELGLVQDEYYLYKPVYFRINRQDRSCDSQRLGDDCYTVNTALTTPRHLRNAVGYLDKMGWGYKLKDNRLYIKNLLPLFERTNYRMSGIAALSRESDRRYGLWNEESIRDFMPIEGGDADRPGADVARSPAILANRPDLTCVLEYYLVDFINTQPVRVPKTVADDRGLVRIYLARAGDRALLVEARRLECSDYRYVEVWPAGLRRHGTGTSDALPSDGDLDAFTAVLAYYWVPHEIEDGRVLIPAIVSGDAELMAHYTSRARDAAWLAAAREKLADRSWKPPSSGPGDAPRAPAEPP